MITYDFDPNLVPHQRPHPTSTSANHSLRPVSDSYPIRSQVALDGEFLRCNHIMDYSLLLGLHFRAANRSSHLITASDASPATPPGAWSGHAGWRLWRNFPGTFLRET